jgi:hypothetical protein
MRGRKRRSPFAGLKVNGLGGRAEENPFILRLSKYVFRTLDSSGDLYI